MVILYPISLKVILAFLVHEKLVFTITIKKITCMLKLHIYQKENRKGTKKWILNVTRGNYVSVKLFHDVKKSLASILHVLDYHTIKRKINFSLEIFASLLYKIHICYPNEDDLLSIVICMIMFLIRLITYQYTLFLNMIKGVT